MNLFWTQFYIRHANFVVVVILRWDRQLPHHPLYLYWCASTMFNVASVRYSCVCLILHVTRSQSTIRSWRCHQCIDTNTNRIFHLPTHFLVTRAIVWLTSVRPHRSGKVSDHPGRRSSRTHRWTTSRRVERPSYDTRWRRHIHIRPRNGVRIPLYSMTWRTIARPLPSKETVSHCLFVVQTAVECSRVNLQMSDMWVSSQTLISCEGEDD